MPVLGNRRLSFRTELRWVTRCWWAVLLLGVVRVTWASSGSQHSVRIGALLVAPYLLVGLHRLSRSTKRAAPQLRRTFAVALVLTAAVAVVDYLLPGTTGGGLSLLPLGLLAFAAGLRAWCSEHRLGVNTHWRWAWALSLLASIGVAVAWTAWIVRGVVDGTWASVDVTQKGAAVAALAAAGGVVALASLLSVAVATRATLHALDHGPRRAKAPAPVTTASAEDQ